MSRLRLLLLIFITHGLLDNTGRALPVDGINTAAGNPSFQQESEINRNIAPGLNNDNQGKDTTGIIGGDLPQRETVDKQGGGTVIKQNDEGNFQQEKSYSPVNLNIPRISLDQHVSSSNQDSLGFQNEQQENSVKESVKLADNFRSNPSVNNEETKVITNPDLKLNPSEQDRNSETQQIQNPGLPNLNLHSSNQGLPDHQTALQNVGQGTQDQQPSQKSLDQSPHLINLKEGTNGEKLHLSNLNTQGQRPAFSDLKSPESEMTNSKPALQEGNPGLQKQESQGQNLLGLKLGQGSRDQKPDLSKELQNQNLPSLNLNVNTHDDQSTLVSHFGQEEQHQKQLLPDPNSEKQKENLPVPKFGKDLNLPSLNVGQNVQVQDSQSPDFHPEVNNDNSFSSKIDQPKPSYDSSSLNQDQGQNVNMPVLNQNQEALQNQVNSLQEQNSQIVSENKDIQRKLDSENTYQGTDRTIGSFATTISQGNYPGENQLNEDNEIENNAYDDKQQNKEHPDDEDGINIQDKVEGIGNIPNDIEQGSDDQPSDPYEDKFRENNEDSNSVEDVDSWYNMPEGDDKGDEDFYRLETLHNNGDENNDQEEKEEETHDQFAMDDEDIFNSYQEKKPDQQDVQYDNGVYIDPISQKPIYREGVIEYNLVSNRNSLNTPSSMVLFYTWIILIVLVAVVTFSAFRYRCLGSGRNHRNGGYRSGEESKRLLDNMYM